MSFDTLAPHYRVMESILAGGILQRCRTAFLAEASACRSALLLGEGPGLFLVELLRANPRVEVVCVDQSRRMMEQARHTLERNGLLGSRVRFEQRDALTWQPPPSAFDLVVTNFFLDCFQRPELEALIAKVAKSATDEARWLMADFRVPERGWRRARARAVLTVMYAFFRCATGLSASRLIPPEEFLKAAGFRLTHQRVANFGLVHADLWLRTRA